MLAVDRLAPLRQVPAHIRHVRLGVSKTPPRTGFWLTSQALVGPLAFGDALRGGRDGLVQGEALLVQ
jgi:hypothetical protein